MCNIQKGIVDGERNGRKPDRRTAYTKMVNQESQNPAEEESPLRVHGKEALCDSGYQLTFYGNYQDIYGVYAFIEEELKGSQIGRGNTEKDRYRMPKIIYENQTYYCEFLDLRLESL